MHEHTRVLDIAKHKTNVGPNKTGNAKHRGSRAHVEIIQTPIKTRVWALLCVVFSSGAGNTLHVQPLCLPTCRNTSLVLGSLLRCALSWFPISRNVEKSEITVFPAQCKSKVLRMLEVAVFLGICAQGTCYFDKFACLPPEPLLCLRGTFRGGALPWFPISRNVEKVGNSSVSCTR